MFRAFLPMTPSERPPSPLGSALDRAGFRYGEVVLVACSGGADSRALLVALYERSEALGLMVVAGHVDHGLRPESAAEAEGLSRDLASLGIPLLVERVRVPTDGQGPEAAARTERYRALDRMARSVGATAITLAHHADDQLETVLYRLAKGTGRTGMLGMAPVRVRPEGPRLVRPFLGLRRSDLVAFLEERGLGWYEDPSNADPAVPRNRIRREVAPVLRALNPALERTLGANLAVWGDEEALLERLADEAWDRVIRTRAPGVAALDRLGFAGLDPALQRRVAARAVETVRGTRRGLTRELLERIRLAGDRPREDLGGGLIVSVAPDRIWLEGPLDPIPPVPARIGAEGPCGARLEAVTASLPAPDPDRAWFDADALPPDLVWRTGVVPRDRITPWGHARSRTLGQALAKARVPRPLRDRLLVLASGDEVLWVPGCLRSASAPIGPASRRVVMASVDRLAWFDIPRTRPYHGPES